MQVIDERTYENKKRDEDDVDTSKFHVRISSLSNFSSNIRIHVVSPYIQILSSPLRRSPAVLYLYFAFCTNQIEALRAVGKWINLCKSSKRNIVGYKYRKNLQFLEKNESNESIEDNIIFSYLKRFRSYWHLNWPTIFNINIITHR